MKPTGGLVVLITGTRKGIGRYLAEHYTAKGCPVIGCSREATDFALDGYRHFCLDVADEVGVQRMFAEVRDAYPRLDVLVNNAGIASMNHVLVTPLKTVERIMSTNVLGSFLFCREAAKLMSANKWGRIVNFATVATPLKLEGEAIYAASKAAVASLTQILARELAPYNITVNAVGPTPIETDLIRSVPKEKIAALLQRQAIPRLGEFRDVANVVDFFVRPESDFITGQTVFLGGVS
ncbi:MAG: SDR family NAD(P)-dependent oxidoreductase [Candidatus Acidiferrales bacterium]